MAPTKKASPASKKSTAKKAPSERAPAKAAKQPAGKAAVAKKSPVKKPAAKKPPPVKKTVAKAPAKKAPPAKKAAPVAKAAAPAKKAAPVAKAAAPAKKVADEATKAPARKLGAPTKAAPPAKPAKPTRGPYASDTKFLDEQRTLLLEERIEYQRQADDLKAEADSLALDREPGDVQFDEESGEGGTVAVDRERDLTLSAQALATIDEIDFALVGIEKKMYGMCENCGQAIPKARLRVLPYARLCVACKSGGLHRR